MSRSYKKTPVSTCGGRCGGTRKYWKIQANRKVRKERTLRNKSKNYKKIYETWNIRDYRFYERKPTEIDGDWVAKWNNKITNGDTVYILGDISFRGKNENLIAYISTLKGHKILVRGNHDDVSDYRYRQLFEDVCDYKEIHDSVDGKNYDLVLCHYPIFSWKKMGKSSILLYGHTHNSQEDDYYQRCLADMINND